LVNVHYCVLFSSRVRVRVRVRIRFCVWFASGYAHVFYTMVRCRCTVHGPTLPRGFRPPIILCILTCRPVAKLLQKCRRSVSGMLRNCFRAGKPIFVVGGGSSRVSRPALEALPQRRILPDAAPHLGGGLQRKLRRRQPRGALPVPGPVVGPRHRRQGRRVAVCRRRRSTSAGQTTLRERRHATLPHPGRALLRLPDDDVIVAASSRASAQSASSTAQRAAVREETEGSA